MRTNKLDALIKKKCDTVFITSMGDMPDMNLQYYSGIDAEHASGAVMWKIGKEPVLVTRDSKQKKRVRLVTKKDAETVYTELKKIRPKKIGVNMNYLPVNWVKRIKKKSGAKLVDISKELNQVRVIKEKQEIKNISKACDVTRKILNKINLVGRTEAEVYQELVSFYAGKSLPVSFDPIVASGKNTQLIHTRATGKLIENKDTVIIDTGCRVNGYCSDITVTRCAEPNKQTEEMLLRVFSASKLALREARPGMKASELCELVKQDLGKYSKYWVYGLGHGLGLNIHEAPNVYLDSKDVLEKGMVFTLEPGLVGPGQGARIEYTGVLTNNGFKVL